MGNVRFMHKLQTLTSYSKTWNIRRVPYAAYLERLPKELNSLTDRRELGIVVDTQEGHDEEQLVRIKRVLQDLKDRATMIAWVVGEGR